MHITATAEIHQARRRRRTSAAAERFYYNQLKLLTQLQAMLTSIFMRLLYSFLALCAAMQPCNR